MTDAENSEYLLVLGLQAGNAGAYQKLYDLYASRLKALAVRLRLSEEEANEIVQETFIRIWLHRQKIEPAASFSAFIITIARHLIYNQVRKSATRENYIREVSGQMNMLHDMQSHGELQRLIHHLLQQLPDKCRQVFRKSRFDGYSNAQIAEEMNISKSTVENQLNKALKLLRKGLEEKGYGPTLVFLYIFLQSQ